MITELLFAPRVVPVPNARPSAVPALQIATATRRMVAKWPPRLRSITVALAARFVLWHTQQPPVQIASAQSPPAKLTGQIAITTRPTAAKPIYQLQRPIAALAATLAIPPTETRVALPANAASPAQQALAIATQT